jgi:hypothetical protein
MANSAIIITCGALLIAPILVTAQSDPCTVCPNGDPITLPEKALSLPGFEIIDSCGTLDSAIGLFFQTDSDECNLVHAASSICGCPIPEGACYLCGEGASVQQPDREVPYLLDIDALTPTCEFIEAYLHSVSEADSACGVAQAFTSSYCGCPESLPLEGPICTLCPRGEAVPDANRTLSIGGIPFETCGEAEQAAALYLSQASDTCDLFQSVSSLCGCETLSSVESPCSLCPDGSPVSLPDEDLTFLFVGSSAFSIGEADLEGVQPTCQVVEAFAKSFEEGSRECLAAQFVAGVCGCPPVENACDFCPGEDVPLPDKVLERASVYIDFTPTCGQIDDLCTQTKKGSDFCLLALRANYLCGCQGGERYYLGAETQAQKAALAWVPRISAFLSIFGSSMIIYDIVRDPIKCGSVFHTLMLAMSVLDIFSSIAWGLTTLPIPEYEFGEQSQFYGAKGNTKTCKTQGFFIQLGYTSLFYNMSLSFYFLMVVRYGMKEYQIKKLQLWLHVPALVVGFGLAFGGIHRYQNDGWGCYIPPPPIAQDYRSILIFAVVPISIAIIIATVNMVLLYWAVRQQMIAARKWQFSWAAKQQQQVAKSSLSRNEDAACALPTNADVSGESFQPRSPQKRLQYNRQSSIQIMERQTFWQALFYLGAFYVTWPFLLASQLIQSAQEIYPFTLVVLILGPLQGFLNFLVYARPRVLKRMEERRKMSRRQLQQATNDTAATSKYTVTHRQVQHESKDTTADLENTVLGAPVVSSTRFDLSTLREEEKKEEEHLCQTQNDA